MNDILNNGGRFTLIAGPCVIESEENVMEIAKTVKEITDRLGIDYYFKASFDKANRTSAEHYRGPGIEKGLQILSDVKSKLNLKVVTDIHEPWQAKEVGEVANIVQIPAFLCRQTDLLKAAAKTDRIVNVKKAQFMSPEEMQKVISKLEYFGNKKILLCERGSCFGYHDQIVDMTGIVRMKALGYPVVFDATHSVQISGGGNGFSNSGARQYVPCLAKAAIAAGADILFMEVHTNPEEGLCDASCMWPTYQLEGLLTTLMRVKEAII